MSDAHRFRDDAAGAAVPEPDLDAAIDFLCHWYGTVVLVAILPDTGRTEAHVFRKTDPDATRAWIETWQMRGYGIHHHVNRTRDNVCKKATREEMENALAAHVDVDPSKEPGADKEAGRATILAELEAQKPPFDVIVDTGNGYAGYYRLWHEAGQDLRGVEARNLALVEMFGGDPSAHNIDRIMRVPGTLNYPNASKRRAGWGVGVARVVRANWDSFHGLDELPVPLDVPADDQVHHEHDRPSDDTVRAALDAIPPDKLDYHEWFAVSTVVHIHFGGSDEGRALWEAWCARDPARYNRRTERQRWRTLGRSRAPGAKVVGYGTLFHIAKQQGFVVPSAGRAGKPGRVVLPMPAKGDEWLPVMMEIDEVLAAMQAPVPPMRNVVGRNVYVETQTPIGLHLLTSASADADRSAPSIPAPPQRLLLYHDRYTLGHEIERHIAYEIVVGGKKKQRRTKSLPMLFVDHYLRFRESRLPRVSAIVTSPLVLLDGTVLAHEGLDRERGLLFDIDPVLLAALPSREECTDEAAAEALRFLTDEWLCDVTTDFDGKCILVAMALSILQRALFSEKPCFFVTAPQRGGGKTTVVAMISVAATGHRAAARGWSDSEEERRKAILATLATGVAMMVWDNIRRGEAISCPNVEKVLTSPTFTDRVLGKTEDKTVSTATIMAFTGNNIGPRGDLASRALIAQLGVDRPDPENRTFAHPDPISWTRANTTRIRRALHTILLANPRLAGGAQTPAKTRFRDWWCSIGAAIEHAAAQLGQEVDFGRLFAVSDEYDEEAIGIGEVLRHLQSWMPSTDAVKQKFTSAMLRRRLVEETEYTPEWVLGLRDFFAPGRKISELSTKRIGHALGKIVGTLVLVGDGRTMALESEIDPHDKVRRFWIRSSGAVVWGAVDDDSPL
jgi:hypothetical protein